MEDGKQEHSISEEGDMAQSKPKQRGVGCNPFKRRYEKDASEKCEVPLVGFEPEPTKQRRSFVYEDPALESSEVVTPISPHALKLFEAIREDEMELVEAELSTLTDKREIDKLGGHGFALIHVAARYNFSRIVTTLLDHGANINVGTSDYRWTPLHLAARCVETFKRYILHYIYSNVSESTLEIYILLTRITEIIASLRNRMCATRVKNLFIALLFLGN